tara:strand:- start:360 stop:710 length:351 start_codon:yes stop_codon:yes gene_type:complete
MSDQFKMKGVVERIFDTEQVSDKFKKRMFVINDQADKYPQSVSFQLVQDKVNIIDSLAEGQEVEVAFNIRGREWTSPQGEVKYFNSLEAWRVEATAKAPSAPVSPAASESGDDLPF